MQQTCLLGDTDIFGLYTELTSKKFSYQKILAETDILTNLYYHQIRDGSQAIRIPTRYCTTNLTILVLKNHRFFGILLDLYFSIFLKKKGQRGWSHCSWITNKLF